MSRTSHKTETDKKITGYTWVRQKYEQRCQQQYCLQRQRSSRNKPSGHKGGV